MTHCVLDSSACFFYHLQILQLTLKRSFRNTIRVSKNLDEDPDLGPNYSQRLSADEKSSHILARKELKETETDVRGMQK